jgi:hypothetical protein
MNCRVSIPKFLLVAASLITPSCSAVSGIFASPTPTATATPIPTSTPTSTPTPLPTATPTMTPTAEPAGVVAQKQADGTTLVVDYDNQFVVSLASDWAVVPIGGADIGAALDELAKTNPDFAESAQVFSQMDPSTVRVVALNGDRRYYFQGVTPVVFIMVFSDKLMTSLPLSLLASSTADGMKQQGATILDQASGQNANAIDYETIEYLQSAPTASGGKVTLQATMLLFKAEGAVVAVVVEAPKQFAPDFAAESKKIADSVDLGPH